jgi:hypothetical protein
MTTTKNPKLSIKKEEVNEFKDQIKEEVTTPKRDSRKRSKQSTKEEGKHSLSKTIHFFNCYRA